MKKIFENWRDHLTSEATRADKEGVILRDMLSIMQQYVSEDTFNPTHFATFHEINKIGINPKTPYKTPVGIYAYPILPEFMRQVREGTVPFASDAKYISILEPTSPETILSVSNTNISKLRILKKLISRETVKKFALEGQTLEADIERIELAIRVFGKNREKENFPTQQFDRDPWWYVVWASGSGKGASEIYNKSEKGAKRQNDFAKIFMATWLASEKNPAVWNGILRYLGFSAVYDTNAGVIHPNEKQQAVFLSKSAIKVIKTIPNKMDKDIMRKKRNKKEYGIDFKRVHRDY